MVSVSILNTHEPKKLRSFISEANKNIRAQISAEIKVERKKFSEEMMKKRKIEKEKRLIKIPRGIKKEGLIKVIMDNKKHFEKVDIKKNVSQQDKIKELDNEIKDSTPKIKDMSSSQLVSLSKKYAMFKDLVGLDNKKHKGIVKAILTRQKELKKPKIPTIKITEAEEPKGGGRADPKSNLPPIPKPTAKLRIAPKKPKAQLGESGLGQKRKREEGPAKKKKVIDVPRKSPKAKVFSKGGKFFKPKEKKEEAGPAEKQLIDLGKALKDNNLKFARYGKSEKFIYDLDKNQFNKKVIEAELSSDKGTLQGKYTSPDGRIKKFVLDLVPKDFKRKQVSQKEQVKQIQEEKKQVRKQFEEEQKKKEQAKKEEPKLTKEKRQRIQKKINELGKKLVEERKKLGEKISGKALELQVRKALGEVDKKIEKQKQKPKPPADEVIRIPLMIQAAKSARKRNNPSKGLELQLKELNDKYDLSEFDLDFLNDEKPKEQAKQTEKPKDQAKQTEKPKKKKKKESRLERIRRERKEAIERDKGKVLPELNDFSKNAQKEFLKYLKEENESGFTLEDQKDLLEYMEDLADRLPKERAARQELNGFDKERMVLFNALFPKEYITYIEVVNDITGRKEGIVAAQEKKAAKEQAAAEKKRSQEALKIEKQMRKQEEAEAKQKAKDKKEYDAYIKKNPFKN